MLYTHPQQGGGGGVTVLHIKLIQNNMKYHLYTKNSR